MNTRIIVAVVAAVLLPATSSAQVPSASAAAFGMSGNYIAAARGFDAVAWNPANLGVDTRAFTLNLVSGNGYTGLDPVSFNSIADFGGKVIPATTKEAWLQQIGAGREHGSVDAGLSVVAASIMNFGFQLGLVGTGDANINSDAAEAILFGNAGRTGAAKSFAFNGSTANGSVFAVGAVSLGIPVMHSDASTFAIGITGKYIKGIGSARASDNGSSVTPDNINVQFPTVYTDSASLGDAGSGIGVDVGVVWSNAATTFAATVRNVANSFAWSTSAFRTRVGTFTFDGTNNNSSFDEASYLSAPAALRAALEAEKFKPEVVVGASHMFTPSLMLSAEAGQRAEGGIDIGPRMHAGVGAEFTGLPVLTLRAGASVISDGFQAAAGVGIHLGPVEIGLGASVRNRSSAQSFGGMLSLVTIQ